MGEGANSAIAAVLFTDLVGSTELRSRLGDRAADDIRRAHDHAFSAAVEGCAGKVVKGLGDGGMAVFPACADALDAAVAVQRAIYEINRAGKVPEPVGLRVGISAGDVTWEKGDCFGTPVIEADRLCDTAAAGEIICAEAVRWLARGRSGLTFRSLGAVELKGLPDPVPAAALEWAPAPSLAVPLPAWTIGREETSFVGRTDERDRLLELWKEAETGERRFVVVSGEPGIGKTRLAVELARTVIDRGGLALAGRCDEDLAVPFQPFAEAIRQLVEHIDGDPRPRLGRFATDLSQLVPGLAERMGSVDTGGAADEEGERWRLFDAVASCVQGLAADQPVLLLLDDLHWASRPTLQLLGHVLRSVERVPLLVLATYRDTELRRTHPLAEALADLRGRVGVERVSLRGLSSAEVVALLESAAGHELGPNGQQLAAAICEETEGNPFFVGEVARNLIESGRVYERDGRWVIDGSVASLGIPEGVREVIGRRLSRLSAASNEALVIGAVVGSIFDRATVEAAGGGSGEALDDALDEAVDSGLLEEQLGKPGSYRFAHTLVRSTLYEELRTARRVRLHAKVGEAIEQLHRRHLDAHLPDLAHHYAAAAAAGLADKAIDYAMRAGRAASAVGAFDEAARFCEVGLDAAELSGDDASMCDLLLAAAEAEWRAGEPLRAQRSCEQAAALASEIEDAERFARATYLAGGPMRHFWVSVGRINRTLVAQLEMAADRLPDEDSTLRAQVLAMLARELAFEPSALERRRQLADEAVAMARRVGDEREVCSVLYHWFLATVPCGSTAAERDAAVDEMIAIARRQNDGELEIRAQWAAAHGALERLDRDAFDRAVDRMVELAERLRQGTFRWMAASLIAAQAYLDGDLVEGDRLATEALVIGQQADEPTAYEACGVQLTVSTTWRDDARLLGHMYVLLGRLYPTFSMNVAWPLANAMLDGRTQDLEELVSSLDLDAVSQDAAFILSLGMVSFTVAATGNKERARELLVAWGPYRGLGALPTGPVALFYTEPFCRGSLQLVLGQHDEAVTALTEAVDGFERLRAPVHVVWAKIELGRAHALRDGQRDRDRAAALWDEAEVTAGDLGISYMTRRVAEVRADPTTPDSWVGATPAGRRASLRARAERAIGMIVSGQVGRWVRDRDDADVERRFGSARVQRTVFNAMARSVDEDNAGDIDGDVVFELSRVSGTAAFPEPDVWTVELRHGEAKSRQGSSPAPLLVVKLGIPDWVRILGGELGAWEALVNRRMRMEGDMMTAMRMEAIFGGALELAGPDLD